MEQTTNRFFDWAQDPSRTLEERFGIVRLMEEVYQHHYRGEDRENLDWRVMQQVREARKFNPAYDPRPDARKLRATADLLPQVEELRLETSLRDDRPLRDIAVLAFLPGLRSLVLRGFEGDRLDALRHLAALRKLVIHCEDVEDFTPLAGCRELRALEIRTQHPWPVLEGLESLPHLEDFHWSGNRSVLATLACLPALRSLHLNAEYYKADLPNSLRDFHQLPEMPRLDYLWGGWFYRLDGIERYPRLRFANVWGFFKDLRPFLALPELSHLRVNSPRLEDVTAVAEMPSVRHLAVLSERPQDWCSLMESETLREVFHPGMLPDHDLKQSELETLRMLIPAWDDIFALREPRALEPLRLLVAGENERPRVESHSAASSFGTGPENWDGHLGMQQSESWWVEQFIHAALRDAGLLKLQGLRFGVKPPDVFSLFSTEPRPWATRQLGINLLKSEVIGRMGEVIGCLRRALSRIRYPWQFYVMVQPEPDADTWDESWREDRKKSYGEEMEEVERESEFQRQRRLTYLKDEQRLRLLRELGEDTEEFRPSPLPQRPEEVEPPATKADSGKEDDEDDGDDDDGGGTAFFDDDAAEDDESWLPEVQTGDPNRDWNSLLCMFILSERGIHMRWNNRGLPAIADLLDLVPEADPDVLPE